MLFVAGESIFAYLWLVAFLGCGWAQEAPHNSRSSSFCSIPPQPTNGRWKLHRLYCGSDLDCDVPQVVGLQSGSRLIYSCNAGYRVDEDTDVYCTAKGNWSAIPSCIELRCPSLDSVSRITTCYRLDESVDCASPVLPETRAQVSCRPGYRKDTELLLEQGESVTCNENGKWEPDPIRCVPACGTTRTSELTTFSASDTMTGYDEFPWHANVFLELNKVESIRRKALCGATVIRPNILLTAADCVRDYETNTTTQLGKLFITMGTTFRVSRSGPGEIPPEDTIIAVKKVHIRYNCDGPVKSRSWNIALLELEQPVVFSSIFLPACLDVPGYSEQVLEPGAYGRLVTFARDSLGESRGFLLTSAVPYVSYSSCKSIVEGTKFADLLTNDTFCAGYMNVSATSYCVNYIGSGLVLKKNDRWYVMGILTSRLTPRNSTHGKDTCVGNSASLYTKVSYHMPWILNVIFILERYGSYAPCSRNVPANHTTTTSPTPTIEPTDDRFFPNLEGSSCSAPPQPVNGQWRLQKYLCKDNTNCATPEGASLRPGTQLIYSCTPGYRANGSVDVYCGVSGSWSAIPICIEIKCDSLNSESRTASCSHSGKSVDCNSPVPPGTRAEVSCSLGYKKDATSRTTQRAIVNCDENGIWEPNPIRCIPACGLVKIDQKPFVVNGTTADVNDFPWHASLYLQLKSSNVTKHFICGATIIRTNFLLTAAHCIYDERTKNTVDPSKLFVMTGNIFRDFDSPWHNTQIVRKGTVKNIYKHFNYYGLLGNYVSDIAILELHQSFELSSILLPACLDVDGYDVQILEDGSYGKVAGFGRTEKGRTSGILQTITVPYILYKQCKNSNYAPENQVLISNEKFCAGYNNGTAVCEGDSGGGLVFKKNDLWYVLGIVSVGLGVDFTNGEKTCDRYSYTLYTKVTTYMDWIQDVTSNPGRYKSFDFEPTTSGRNR